jgi:predicted transcriptional regulator
MTEAMLDQQMQALWQKLEPQGKEEVLEVMRQLEEEEVDLETYSREIEEALARVKAGRAVPHREALEKIRAAVHGH